MFGQIWGALDPAICAAGFRKSGIYPLNKNAISEDKFNQVLLREWKHNSTCDATNIIEDPIKQVLNDVPLYTEQPKYSPESLLALSLKSIDLTLYIPTFSDFPQNSTEEYSGNSLNQLSYESTSSVNIRKPKIQILENRVVRKKQKHSSSIETDTEIIYDEDSDDYDFWEKILHGSSDDDKAEDIELDDGKENDVNSVGKNDWVLVKFCTKKSLKHYVGAVVNINDNDSPVIKYTRRKSKAETSTVFAFPVVHDISELKHAEDIITKLPTPAIG
ncbi:unnamed protein product [Parnassius apollo]|uniref:(apollo) hypothetical protein n=1 Tax=Parnassius apollo TaxID=110799 RepID=A0A8S3XU14_PARAO|nr:unnamed protein product [Parnassius apollo]